MVEIQMVKQRRFQAKPGEARRVHRVARSAAAAPVAPGWGCLVSPGPANGARVIAQHHSIIGAKWRNSDLRGGLCCLEN